MQQFNGIEYLKIDVANSFGLDKKKWNERLAWFNENEHQLDSLIEQADSPAMFFAGVQAYRDAREGKPIGYPISLDATASGMQILACLTGDRKAAELCNVVPVFGDDAEALRIDGYTVIYDRMVTTIGEAGQIERDDCKQGIMTSLYGSQAMPKKVFGEGKLYYTFQDTMNESAPAVWELNSAFLDIWDPEATEHNWTLPDLFHVKVKVMDEETETVHFLNAPYDTYRKVNRATESGRSLGANGTHSIDGYVVREMIRRCMYDMELIRNVRRMIAENKAGYKIQPVKDADYDMVVSLWDMYLKTGMLSLRICDYLDYDNIGLVDVEVVEALLDTLPKKPFQVITNHDCFRCLPHYGNDLRKQYNRMLYELAKGNLLSHMLSQMTNSEVQIGKLDPTLADDILNTEYALS
ncbi:RNA polymerase 2 [Erwinia phage Kuerle]|nr:RNA polymerase 2 [Erwinia phage Kuerle]